MNKIIIDKGLLPLKDKSLSTDISFWADKIFVKYFGASLRFNFNQYKNLSFKFKDLLHTETVYIQNSFNDFNDFTSYVNTVFGDGSYYTTNVELELYMDIDTKIPEPTIYAKNAMLGALSGRNGYRKSIYVFEGETSSIENNVFVNILRDAWLECFGEDLTNSFIQNHRADFAKMFWVKKDCDRMGVLKQNQEVSPISSNQRYLYNSTKSDPASDTLIYGTTTQAGSATPQAYIYSGVYDNPKLFIYEIDNYSNKILTSDLGGARAMYRELAQGRGFSTFVAMPIEVRFDNGNGDNDTYRALHISPVGVDTIYFDYINEKDFRVYSIRKYANGNIRVKNLPFMAGGDGQRVGRIHNGYWLDFDANDTKSESTDKGMGEIYFAYQDIKTGKFSPLSSSRLEMFKDSRFRLPVFVLKS